MPPNRLVNSIPLKPVVHLILHALADGDAHGYAIRATVSELSDGALELDPGSLYRHLARLLEDGLVTEVVGRVDPELDDSRRRYYALTKAGRALLVAETERLAKLVDTARANRMIPKGSRS